MGAGFEGRQDLAVEERRVQRKRTTSFQRDQMGENWFNVYASGFRVMRTCGDFLLRSTSNLDSKTQMKTHAPQITRRHRPISHAIPHSLTTITFVATASLALLIQPLRADWAQWRGTNRDGKASGFAAPQTWPKELVQKWKTAVGEGVATPALVGDKLYVFSREGSDEIIRCLESATGKELWQYKYEAQGASGPASAFPGPRSSPAVADGKVVTLGVRGALCCLDAGSGKLLWRKDDFNGATPNFFVASSPLIAMACALPSSAAETMARS